MSSACPSATVKVFELAFAPRFDLAGHPNVRVRGASGYGADALMYPSAEGAGVPVSLTPKDEQVAANEFVRRLPSRANGKLAFGYPPAPLATQQALARMTGRPVTCDACKPHVFAEASFGPAGRVERDRQVVGLLVGAHLGQHRREPVHRVGDGARLGREVGRQGKEGPVGQRQAVEQEELGHLGRSYAGGAT